MAKYVRCLMKMSLYIVQAEWYNGAMKRIYLFGSLNADLTIRAPYLPKAGETLTGSDFMLASAEAGDIFMTQLETPFEVVRYALKTARARGLFTVFNPAPAVREAQELVPLADLITPNETELAILTGEERGEEGCRKLLAMGAGAVLATCGAHGSLYCGQDGIRDGSNTASTTIRISSRICQAASPRSRCSEPSQRLITQRKWA